MHGGLSRRTFIRGAGLAMGATALGGPVAASGLARTTSTHAVGAGDVLRLARVWWKGAEDAALLSLFDDTHHVYDDGSVEVLLWPGDLARLKQSGLRFDITVEDVIARDNAALAAADAQTGFTGSVPGQRDDYRTLEQFEDDLLGLVNRFPDEARLIVMPEPSLEGRQVYGIEIADDVANDDGRPVFYMDGLHHAREWPSGELTIFWAFELLENPENDERIASLRRDVRTILVPVVNPDGFSWSRTHPTHSNSTASLGLAVAGQASYWRKNRRGLMTDVVVPVVNRNVTAHGVDINRNYTARWGGPGASSSEVNQTYRGAAPLSEPEVRNVAQLVRERQPIVVNTNHTYTGLVLRPWGHTGGDGRYTPDEDLLRDLGAAMCEVNRYRNIHSIDLYATTGTTQDWTYAAVGSLSYTYEIGFSNFHPPYAGNDGALHHYGLNREPFIMLAQAAQQQEVTHHEILQTRPHEFVRGPERTYQTYAVITGRVVDEHGEPVEATLTAERTTQIPLGAGGGGGFSEEPSKATIRSGADGTFAWHLPPSTSPTAKERGEEEAWELTASGPGGTASRSVVVDRGDTAELGNVELA